MKNQNTNKKTNTQKPVMETAPEQPKARSVKEVLAEDAIMLKGMNFTMDEARKFFPIFAKLEEDLVACVEAIDREERKAMETQKVSRETISEVKRYEEAQQSAEANPE